MNTVLMGLVVACVVLYFLKDADGNTYLANLLRRFKLIPPLPEPKKTQVFNNYVALAEEVIDEDPEKAKEYMAKAVEVSKGYDEKESETDLVKPKELSVSDYVNSPAAAIAFVFVVILLLSQCNLKPINVDIPDFKVDEVKQFMGF